MTPGSTGSVGRAADQPTVSVIVPVYCNADTLGELVERTLHALVPTYEEVDITLVDDCSLDDSWDVICQLAGLDRRVRGIRLESNVGNLTARAAGCADAGGEVVCTLDADLENAPEDLVALVQKVVAGHDLVSAVRVDQRGRPFGLRMASRATRRLVANRWNFAPRDFGCGLKAWRAELGKTANGYLATDRDVRWAVRLFDQARSYAEVEVQRRDRGRRSDHGWRRRLGQGIGLASALWGQRPPVKAGSEDHGLPPYVVIERCEIR